jgi:hypothetical protein
VTYPRDGVDCAHTGREQTVVGGVLIGVEAGFEFGIEAELALNHHPPHAVDAAGAALRPIWRYVFCHPVDVLDRDHFLAVEHADAAEPDRCHGAGFDHPGQGLESPWRWCELARFANLVQSYAERLGDHGDRVVFEGDYVRQHVTHGYAVTVHSAQGVTADTTHAVLGENTTRSMLYVAITRGRETNTAYIYRRAAEQEYGLDPLPGAHVMDRGTAFHAGRLARAIIANHDQPITAHEVAAQTPSAALPERVRRIHDRRASMLQRRRATYQSWQADAQSFARAMTTARERHNSRSRDHSLDCGIEI